MNGEGGRGGRKLEGEEEEEGVIDKQ